MSTCFHCGLPASNNALFASIGGQAQPVCCLGCKAVAELISGSGLGRYYDVREAPAGEAVSEPGQDWSRYDQPTMFDTYCKVSDGVADASVQVDGMYCSACSWLVETSIRSLPGVVSVNVNPISHRMYVRWNIGELKLSRILSTLSLLGYRPQPLDDSSQPVDSESKDSLKRLIVAGLGMMQVMMFAIGLYSGEFQGMEPRMEYFLRLVSLAVTTPVVAFAARPFFIGALRGLASRRPGMDLPVAIAIGLAFAASVWSTFTHGDDVWFDSVTMFVFFLTLGRFLEMRARKRAVERGEALTPLLPSTACLLEDGIQQTVPITSLVKGNRILLTAGDLVPADVRVLDGNTTVDESVLTGESVPLSRGPGSTLAAGSINLSGTITASVLRTGRSTALGQVSQLADNALSCKPRLVQLADKVASWIVVAILALGTLVAIAWSTLDPDRAFTVTLSVLVVTCPCALALATPAALAASTSRFASLGLLLKNSDAVEALAKCTHVVFDKTGTLTEGRPRIVSISTFDERWDRDACLAIAASIEATSSHPLARAFDYPASELLASDVVTVPGKGIQAVIEDRSWRLGQFDTATDLDESESVVDLCSEGQVVARFRIVDPLRSDARQLVRDLEEQGLEVHLLSGDHDAAVQKAAHELGIPHYQGRMLPVDKLDRIRQLQSRGAKVLMVGDGINDAPVLAGSDVSIAPSHAAQVAHTKADLVFLGSELKPVASGLATGRRTLKIIRQNLGWAIAYNLSAVPMAAMGMVPTWLAAIGMSASSLLVVLNSLRLSR